MKKSSIISIVLENCEYYDFDAENVIVILDGIQIKQYGTSGPMYVAKHCLIEIDNDAKTLNDLEDWQTDWKDRIDRDITQIQMNGITYHVKWAEDSDYENAYETDLHDKFVHTYIISKTKKNRDDFYE